MHGSVTCIVQARMGASRLPGKVLFDLAGKPMLWHVVRRVQATKHIGAVVVATTTAPRDKEIEDMCNKYGIAYVRGPEDDVLARYRLATALYPSDLVVRIPSDKPLIDPKIISMCIEKCEDGKYDYVSNVHPPEKHDHPSLQGIAVEVVRLTALQKAYEYARYQYEKEHVTPYVWENKNNDFVIHKIVHPPTLLPKYRLTVDYPEDFAVVSAVYKKLYQDGDILDIREVVSLLDGAQDIARLNMHCEQKGYK